LTQLAKNTSMTDASFDVGLGLEGTHVVITGCSGAIGSIVVKAFLAAGANVSGLDIKEITTSETQNKHLRTYSVDITDETALEDAFTTAHQTFGPISSLIAVAGLDLSYVRHASLVDTSLTDWNRTLNVNVTGTFLTCRTWLRHIRDHATTSSRNVSAIIFGSEAGIFGVPDCAAYAASKSAVQYGFVKSLAKDAVGIHPTCRVNAIAPGAVNTPQFQKECQDDPAVLYKDAIATVAMRRPVDIDVVARTCLFLASDSFSGNITGQVVPVDGGKSGSLLWPSED
jgi:NAD(P)-dependent dehydrogenase (short-subunit alcohol dehydrogenase family)